MEGRRQGSRSEFASIREPMTGEHACLVRDRVAANERKRAAVQCVNGEPEAQGFGDRGQERGTRLRLGGAVQWEGEQPLFDVPRAPRSARRETSLSRRRAACLCPVVRRRDDKDSSERRGARSRKSRG